MPGRASRGHRVLVAAVWLQPHSHHSRRSIFSAPEASGVSPGQVGKVRPHVGVSRWVSARGLGMSLEKGTAPLWGSGDCLPGGGQREGWGAGPWLLCGWSVLSSELAGSCARHPSPTGTPALQGPQGKLFCISRS